MPRGLGRRSTIKIVFDELIGMCKYDPISVFRVGGVCEFEEMLRWKEVGWKSLDIKHVKNAIYQLEEKKYILTKRDGDRLFIKLLDDGVEEMLKKTIIEKQIRLPDGEFCYVSFDIPEASRHARLALRTLLRRANFRMIHQSLWCTSFDVAQELATLVHVLKIQNLVYVMKGVAMTAQDIKTLTALDRKIKKKKEKLQSLKNERTQLKRRASNLSMQ